MKSQQTDQTLSKVCQYGKWSDG